MAVPNMIVTLVANTSKFTSGMKKAEHSTGSFSKIAGKAFAAVAAAVATMGLGNLVGDLFNLGIEARKADRRLEYMAKNMSKLSGDTTKTTTRLKAFADQMQMSTGIDDEVIKGVQAMLLAMPKLAKSAGKAGGMFDRVTKSAFDMAALGFGEASSNAKKLARFLDDPIKRIDSLNRLGIIFTQREKDKAAAIEKTGGKAKAAEYLMGILEDRMGGMAEETANPLEILGKRFSEIGEAISIAILPFIDTMSEKFGAWMDSPGGKKAIAEFVQNFVDFGEWITSPDGQKAVQDLADALGYVVTALVNTVTWLKDTVKWWKELLGIRDTYDKKYGGDYGGGTREYPGSPHWNPDIPTPTFGPQSPPGTPENPRSAPVIIFNTPIDSVSAGREVARVLADYQRVRGIA